MRPTTVILFLCSVLGIAMSSMEREVLVGGVSEPHAQPHASPDVMLAATKAIEQINAQPALLKQLDAQGPVSLVKIVDVRTQVVAGINYYLTLELQQQGKPFQVSAVVWSRPWLERSNSGEEPYQVTSLARKEPT